MPAAARIDEEGQFPASLFQKVAELGYLGIRYPAEYGGSEGDNVMFTLMCEELARGSMSLAATVAMQCLMGTDFVYRFGTEEQKQRLVAPAIRGEKLGVIAMTEPDAGSDLWAIKTTERWLVYRAPWLLDSGVRDMKLASMAKLFASEMANQLADGASRVFAGYGLAAEYPVQRYFRAARLLLLGGGTSEILRGIIARQMGL